MKGVVLGELKEADEGSGGTKYFLLCWNEGVLSRDFGLKMSF